MKQRQGASTMTTAQSVLDMTTGTAGLRPEQPFRDRRAWTRGTLAATDWMLPLGATVAEELHGVVAQLRRQSLPVLMLDPADFDMPSSRAMMADVRRTVDGMGIAVVDRLPLDEWTPDEGKAVYWLLGRMLSNPVAQTQKGTIFRDVFNDTNRAAAENGLDAALTESRLTYHNDNSGNRNLPNYTGLLCVNKAKEGGVSEYCTLYALYNAMTKEAPEQLDRLFRPFFHDRLGLQCDGEAAVSWVPCLSFDGDQLTGRFSISKITKGYKRMDEQLDNATLDALECVQQIIPGRELSVKHTMERGQIQFIDNRQGLHYRNDYKDGETIAEKRHLVRLWFRHQGRPFYDG
jgi:hypothetical protein